MTLMLLVWLALFFLFSLLSVFRPAFGIVVYMYTFFLYPAQAWWGQPIGHYRWSLIAGIIALVATLTGRLGSSGGNTRVSRSTLTVAVTAIGILANATFVHVALAADWQTSSTPYWNLAKFVLLYFLLVAACRTQEDLRIVLLAIVIGAGYIGYEVTVNDRGTVTNSRLEGVGAPGATGANQLASLMVTVLPLSGLFFLEGRRWERAAMIPVAPFILNVLILCNSRGAFLACFAMCGVMLAAAPARVRKKVAFLVALGVIALYFLLGDPRIVERFKTTFAPAEKRDWSAQSRLEYQKAGLRMLADYPWGSGGAGFSRVRGVGYIREATGEDLEARSVHNGYINEACEWGAQGLMLKLAFLGAGILLLCQTIVKASRRDAHTGRFGQLLATSLLAGLIGFLVTCLFGDFLDAEWGYWVVALAVAQARLYPSSSEDLTRPGYGTVATRLVCA